MKTIFRILLFLGILVGNVQSMTASLPEVHVIKKFPDGRGKYFKLAYSDIFTTDIYGQNVDMRIIYTTPVKKNPAICFAIFTKNTTIYRNMSEYVNSLTPKLKNFVYTGKRICDIRVKEKNYWMLASKYAVSGVSLDYVSLTFDDLSKTRDDCVSITFPLSFMDGNKYNYDGKNHWKDMLAELCNGDCKAIEYTYYDPETKKAVSVELPVTAEMALVIQCVVKAYDK